jgi:hypothetical protein
MAAKTLMPLVARLVERAIDALAAGRIDQSRLLFEQALRRQALIESRRKLSKGSKKK